MPSVWKFPHRRFLIYYGSVTLVAKRADCKSVTWETPKVRILPGSLKYGNVAQKAEHPAVYRTVSGSRPAVSAFRAVAQCWECAGLSIRRLRDRTPSAWSLG